MGQIVILLYISSAILYECILFNLIECGTFLNIVF